MLYQAYQLQSDLMSPFRLMAQGAERVAVDAQHRKQHDPRMARPPWKCSPACA